MYIYIEGYSHAKFQVSNSSEINQVIVFTPLMLSTYIKKPILNRVKSIVKNRLKSRVHCGSLSVSLYNDQAFFQVFFLTYATAPHVICNHTIFSSGW